VKVSGSREEVTQCIYHICCALLESPPKGEPKLYKPDGGWSGGDNRGYGGGGGSRGRERDSYRRERSPAGYGDSYSSSFEAIADFARRQGGGRRGRDDSRDRDTRVEFTVSNDLVGAVIGKKGAKINEIRQISGATINIMETNRKRERSPDTDRERVIEISGSTTAVTLAKSLINMAMDLGQEGFDRGGGRRDRDDRRGGRFARTRSRSRERVYGGGYDDRRGRRDKFAPY